MKIRQHAYFAISSEALKASEITRRVGLAPDQATLRASRMQDPPRPRFHIWEVRCDEPGLPVDAQIDRVIKRLLPVRAAVRDLVATVDDAAAWLQVVRYFDVEDGEEEKITVTPEGLVKLSGQHQLLGWHLDHDVLAFLVDVGAEFSADEYG
jgi:hypothetical protein